LSGAFKLKNVELMHVCLWSLFNASLLKLFITAYAFSIYPILPPAHLSRNGNQPSSFQTL